MLIDLFMLIPPVVQRSVLSFSFVWGKIRGGPVFPSPQLVLGLSTTCAQAFCYAWTLLLDKLVCLLRVTRFLIALGLGLKRKGPKKKEWPQVDPFGFLRKIQACRAPFQEELKVCNNQSCTPGTCKDRAALKFEKVRCLFGCWKDKC